MMKMMCRVLILLCGAGFLFSGGEAGAIEAPARLRQMRSVAELLPCIGQDIAPKSPDAAKLLLHTALQGRYDWLEALLAVGAWGPEGQLLCRWVAHARPLEGWLELLVEEELEEKEWHFRRFLEGEDDMPLEVLRRMITDSARARTVLMYLLKRGRFLEARCVLPRVRTLNFQMRSMHIHGMTPLLHACGRGSYGGDFGDEYAPHADFARPGQAEMIRILLAAGADPNLPRDGGMEVPIIKAARSGDIESVQLLLAAGAKLHALDCEKKSALDYVVDDGQIFMARYLLSLPGMPPPENVTMKLDAAVEYNRADCVRELLKEGALQRLDAERRQYLLFLAAESHATECFELLQKAGEDVYALREGRNPLGHVLNFYCLDIDKMLHMLRYLLSCDLQRHSDSAFHTMKAAVGDDLREAVSLLLEAGVLERLSEEQRAGLLIHAAEWHAVECFDLLRAAGLDVHALHDGLNPLGYLLKRYYRNPDKVLHMLRYMLSCGLQRHPASAQRVLQDAVAQNFCQAVALLLESGAKPDSPTQARQLMAKAIEIAELTSNRSMVELLRKHGFEEP
ncbi:MAG: hypothetical protein Q4F38_04725 [Akkermansia sp.]|nr:hypothetical protein [Akkermansia sp.]